MKRKAPNLTERYAGALLRIKIGEEWLIPEPLRSTGTAEEIIASTELDHARLVAHGGENRAQNLYPMRKADHREKSKIDTGRAAKAKRNEANTEEFRRNILAKIGQAVTEKTKAKPKAKIQSRGFLSKEERREMKQRYKREA
jgi:hypothetical protein